MLMSDETIIMLTLIPIVVISLIIAVVFYIFRAIGVYSIAKGRGMKNPWLSFIPFVGSFTEGAVADDINAKIKKKTYFAVVLLTTNIIAVLSYVFAAVTIVRFSVDAINYSGYGVPDGFGTFLLSTSLIGLFTLAARIINYVVLYRIFMDYNPQNGALFLVLSILFGIDAFFLFAIRKRPSISIYYANQPQQAPYQMNNNQSNTPYQQ